MRSNPYITRRYGFTLIELIVAMVILSIILVLSLQLTGFATDSVRVSESRVFNDSAARRVFDQIGNDLSQMVVRGDARIEFESKAGNDQFSFLAAMPGLTATDPGNRPVSLITYAIASDAEEGERLLRGSRGHGYADSGSDSLILDPDKPFPAISQGNIDPISKNILRMEVEYLVEKTGKVEKVILPPDKLDDLRGVVISLVTVDDRSRRAIKVSRQKTVADEFGDAVTTKSTLDAWTEKRNALAVAGIPDIPKEALKNIRCYQRTFLIP